MVEMKDFFLFLLRNFFSNLLIVYDNDDKIVVVFVGHIDLFIFNDQLPNEIALIE